MKPTNDRGFMQYGEEFEDAYGASVRVVESSADPLDKVWVFIEGGNLRANRGSAHLTVANMKALRAALDEAIAHKEGA